MKFLPPGFLDALIWSNYSDLTRPHPKWWFSKGNSLISGKSRLVKYYNLARLMLLMLTFYLRRPAATVANYKCCFLLLPAVLADFFWKVKGFYSPENEGMSENQWLEDVFSIVHSPFLGDIR